MKKVKTPCVLESDSQTWLEKRAHSSQKRSRLPSHAHFLPHARALFWYGICGLFRSFRLGCAFGVTRRAQIWSRFQLLKPKPIPVDNSCQRKLVSFSYTKNVSVLGHTFNPILRVTWGMQVHGLHIGSQM